MKLKIVIKVSMSCENDRSKALQIASTMCGVSSVSIGKENDNIEVVGENVDSVNLAKCLRKKFCVADIISVDEVKPDKEKDPDPSKCPPKPCLTPCSHAPPYEALRYSDSNPACRIL